MPQIASRQRKMANEDRGRGSARGRECRLIGGVHGDGSDGERTERTTATQQRCRRTGRSEIAPPRLAPVARPTGLAINRPTIPMADYVAAKNAATARAPGQAKPGAAPPRPPG